MQPTGDQIGAELQAWLARQRCESAKTWGRELCTLTGNTTLVAALDGFELRINVVETIRKYLLFNDQHLAVTFHRGVNRTVGEHEPVCVLHNHQHPGCAVADALVSLVLLGEANWPDKATPSTLREFAMAAQIEQRARRLKLGLIELTLGAWRRSTTSERRLNSVYSSRRGHAVLLLSAMLHLQRHGNRGHQAVHTPPVR